MPEFIDSKSGKRLYHENKTTLEVEKKILAKFTGKDDENSGSYMHRESFDSDVMDAIRSKDASGNPVIKEKSKLSLYDVEYKLDGMVVVPVDKNTGKRLDEKQLELVNKQLGRLWLLKEED
ncbi:MAG: hypothetical protein K8823_634 [Cenarchaeum symbiont of Oopsacas minuta]|nr:hypothetical protein [Cenarchaeum symbiont of Oopsacas minuta]